jgi:hypothetical protein
MGCTYATMLDAILVINTSKHANHAYMALGWFGVDLVGGFLLATPFAFWPLLNLGTSLHFMFAIDLVIAFDEA